MSKVYVFKEALHLVGTSQKTGNPYDIRNLRFVDTTAFDVHVLNYDEKLDRDVTLFSNGDKIEIDLALRAPRMQGQNSSAVVVGIRPVK